MGCMVMDFVRLSNNIITIINEMLKNQILVNYIGHDGDNPESQNIQPKSIAPKGSNERILPYPFDTNFKGTVRSQVHIYYPNLSFENNGYANKTVVFFDVMVHKNIWLVTDNNRKLIRPYQIVGHIIETFKDKHINNLGKLHFLEGNHVVANEEFEGFRLIASITDF
jgi:hypothetical protein